MSTATVRHTAHWDRLYFAIIVALAPQMRDAPQGLAHIAAEIADAAMMERRDVTGGGGVNESV